MRAGRTRYSNGRGEPEILRASLNMYSRRTGRHVRPSQFLSCPAPRRRSTSPSWRHPILADEVLLPDPYYATYEGVIAAAGGIAVPVRADPDRGFHLKADDLRKEITPKTRALLLNTPGNPTGTVFTAEEIAAIGALCREHDLWIVSDEVYATLTYRQHGFRLAFRRSALARAHHRRVFGIEVACHAGLPLRLDRGIGRILPSMSCPFGNHAIRLAAFPRGCDRLLRCRINSPKSMR